MSADPDLAEPFGRALHHERTALAWERTAVATMVAGMLLARYTAMSLPAALAAFGVAQVIVGSCVLVWSGRHYTDLHGPLSEGASPVHPAATRVVGFTTVLFTGIATTLAVVIALS
jgi:uncharacterized membrane protein YidH (DUF202 family)